MSVVCGIRRCGIQGFFKYLFLQFYAQKLYQIYEITQTFLQYYFRSLRLLLQILHSPSSPVPGSWTPGSIRRSNLRRGLSEAWKRWTLGLIYLPINLTPAQHWLSPPEIYIHTEIGMARTPDLSMARLFQNLEGVSCIFV